MPAIHEVATITSKGQITLPKPIRQALGVDVGGKVAFDLTGGRWKQSENALANSGLAGPRLPH